MTNILFYNEQDQICLKTIDGTKTLYDWDIVELGGKFYTYCYGYFYDGIDYGDGDYETNWDIRTHPRHMKIVEMEDAFAPLSYNCVIDEVFKYAEDINSEQHLLMYMISSRVMDEYVKNHESTYYSVSHNEFEEIGGEEFLKQLGELVLEGYSYEYYVYDDKPHDKAYISIIWSYE